MLSEFKIMNVMLLPILKKSISYTLLAVIFMGCYKKPELSDTPKIEFTGMSKYEMRQGFFKEDSLEIYIRIQDGDGDLGYGEENPEENSIILKDSRTGNISERFSFPALPADKIQNGLDAEVRLLIYSTCCLFPGNIPPCSVIPANPFDSLKYEIQVIDRAGNLSNSVTTPFIYLSCN